MTIKYDAVARHYSPRGKNALGVALIGVFFLLLGGCKSLFDSPQGTEDVHQEATLKAMDKLLSTTPEDVVNKGTEAGKGKAGAAVDDTMTKNRKPGDKPEDDGPVKWEAPHMSFERSSKTDMPQLAVWGLDEAIFLVDNEQMQLGKMTREGRIALIGVGNHRLQVKCPSDPPFSADFYLRKGDRIVLRGRCSSDKRAVTNEGKRN